jgi:hypothetical protein
MVLKAPWSVATRSNPNFFEDAKRGGVHFVDAGYDRGETFIFRRAVGATMTCSIEANTVSVRRWMGCSFRTTHE